MSSDVGFFGQVKAGKAQLAAWRAARIPATALRGLPNPFRGKVDPVEVGVLLDAIAEQGALVVSRGAVQFAGETEEGLFWETWGKELAGALRVAATLGLEGWVWMVDEDTRLRVASEGGALVVDQPDDKAFNAARRGAAYRLWRDLDPLEPDLRAAVDETLDRLEHGTKGQAEPPDAFDAIVAALEAIDDGRVAKALGKAADVPSKRGLARPKQVVGNKAGLLKAARESDIVEHRALAIEVLSLVDPEPCARHCRRLATERRTPPAYRAAAMRALGRSKDDASLQVLLDTVYGKKTSADRNDPVLAAVEALASSPHPEAATRTFAARPDHKGARGDTCFSRAVYVTLVQRATGLRGELAAIADDDRSPWSYLAASALICLDGGHSGNFYALAIR